MNEGRKEGRKKGTKIGMDRWMDGRTDGRIVRWMKELLSMNVSLYLPDLFVS